MTAQQPCSMAVHRAEGADLEAIRARAAAALPGPWRWGGNTESERVHLCTDHSGQFFILSPTTRDVEYVYDHFFAEGYALAEYLARIEAQWADYENALDQALEDDFAPIRSQYVRGDSFYWWETPNRAHDVLRYIAEVDEELATWEPWESDPALHPDNGDVGERARIRSFLTEPRDPLDDRDDRRLYLDGDRGSFWLTRGVQTFPDLQLHGRDGFMVGYRDVARYEVLGGKTRAEAGLPPDAGRTNSPLYREDIVGLATPEADFIAHARQDVDDLLALVDELRAALDGAGDLTAADADAGARR